jgi:fucose permease
LVGSPISALTLVFVLGFSLAPVWPTILSRAGEAYPSQSGTVFGILVAMGAVGFAIVPPVVGRVGDAVGIHLALWICFAILVVDLAIFVRLRSGEKQEGSL